MIRKQLYIDADLNDGLRVLAARTGRSEAEHVRIAVREYLERIRGGSADARDPLLEMIGLIPDVHGPRDVAAEHDRYLYGT